LFEIKEKSGNIEFLDSEVFKEKEIEYFILDSNGNLLDSVKIRPKDYLINQLNNEVLQNKKVGLFKLLYSNTFCKISWHVWV